MDNKPFYRKLKNRYCNVHIDDTKRKITDIVLWQLGRLNDPSKPELRPETFSYPNPCVPVDHLEPQLVWINHCTFLVHVDGVNILTDPIWSERCSPLPFIGPKRLHPPACAIEELPQIDYVLVSHDHYDHLDRRTVKKLLARFPKITWVVPLGVKKWLEKLGAKSVIELNWWESVHLTPLNRSGLEIELTAVPSQHYSGRKPLINDRTLWAGYVAQFKRLRGESKKMYFVGDTGYNPHDFKVIGDVFGSMDLSLIPIGTYVPHKFMETVHINPENATNIHQDVNSRLSIGMHWRTFRLSSEEQFQPPFDLYQSMRKAKLSPLDFRVIDPGQCINW